MVFDSNLLICIGARLTTFLEVAGPDALNVPVQAEAEAEYAQTQGSDDWAQQTAQRYLTPGNPPTFNYWPIALTPVYSCLTLLLPDLPALSLE